MTTDSVAFIRESILESLGLDHESYDLLIGEVKDVCEDYSVSFDELVFKEELYRLVNEKQVLPCLYSVEQHELVPEELDKGKLRDYWFCRSSVVSLVPPTNE